MKLFHYIDDVLLTSDSFADLKQCAPELFFFFLTFYYNISYASKNV